jgi:uncharacterized protein YlxW (UPF0749 family)
VAVKMHFVNSLIKLYQFLVGKNVIFYNVDQYALYSSLITISALSKKPKLQNAAPRAQSASSHMVAKIISSILRREIQRKIEDVLEEYQFGF